MSFKHVMPALALVAMLAACSKTDFQPAGKEADPASLSKKGFPSFAEISTTPIGGQGAAEISAYDALTQRLFVVNNEVDDDDNVLVNRIEVLDLSDPANPVKLSPIETAAYGGFVNSVSAWNGHVAAAIESNNKQQPGKVVVFNTATYAAEAVVTVGALPDMVTYSPNGRYILTANEGEPNQAYTVDPEGTVSIIDVQQGYAVTTLGFAGFESQQASLVAKGLRLFGPGASMAQDLEPEYVAVAANSELAWVSLQENNAIARIDLLNKTITNIFPLGFKDHSLPQNPFDASDRDGLFGNFKNWPVKGMYQPDALAVSVHNNTPFVYSANEGDAREYLGTPGYVEARRVGSLSLDAAAFPNAASLKNNANLGRLNVTRANGNTDGDSDYEELYAFGARSFSIWHGETGAQLFDSRNELDELTVANSSQNIDSRMDDKGSEPEGIATGRVGNSSLLFVGLERADAVIVYDITNPLRPVYRQWINTGDAPEGVAFVDADKSPTGKPLLIVSSEGDGIVKIYSVQ